jgi:acyl carrier protein
VIELRKMAEGEKMFEEIIEIIARQLKIDKSVLKNETNILTDMGADSLDIIDIIMSIEEHFRISIDEKSIEKIKTIGDIAEYIESKKRK